MAKRRVKEEEVNLSPENEADAFRSLMMQTINEDLPEQNKISYILDLLNTITGGGMLTGTYTMFAAAPGTGKSTLACQIISNFIKDFKDGYAIYIDSEQATTLDRLVSLGDSVGVNLVKNKKFFHVSYGTSIEKVFEMIRGLVQIKMQFKTENVPAIVVWDSVDASPSEKETEVDSPEKATGQRAKVLNFMFRKHLRLMRKYNIALISVNHITKKLSMDMYEQYDGRLSALGDFVIGGGKAMSYFPYTMIFLRARITKKNDEVLENWGINSGFIVEATTLKCKAFSFKITVPLVFDTVTGFNDLRTKAFNMLEDSWFSGSTKLTLPNYEDGPKFYAKDFIKVYDESDDEFKQKFEETWKEYSKWKFDRYYELKRKLENGEDLTGITDVLDPQTVNDIVDYYEEELKPNSPIFEKEEDEESLDITLKNS